MMENRKEFSKEEIDEIMEEMEEKTPSTSANITFTFPQANSTKIADDVDARSFSTQPPPKSPMQSTFVRSILNAKPERPGKIHPSTPTDERYYDYTNPNIGIAIIFNQIKFKEESERRGSEKDAEDLRDVLTNLGFIVEILENYPTAKIKEFLYKLSKYDHSDNDCLLVTFMSHGKKDGKIFSSDGEFMVNELWENFVGTKCETLIGKPKLFFIQACRGSMTDPGILFTPKPMKRSLGKPSDMVDSKMMNEKKFVIPTLADLLIMYSTSEGFYSFRNPEMGSWFIQALCDELRENSHEEIMTILTGVNRRVAFAKQSFNPHNAEFDAGKQMPIIQSMLTKGLYFLNREQKEKMRQSPKLL